MTAATGGDRRARALALAGLSGALFGAGLVVSGMTQPARVIGFLALSRRWDPSLGFVMFGAVTIYAVLVRWIPRRRTGPWFDVAFHIPTRRDIDRRLVLGAALFGVGWGLGGLCPGPGIVAAASGSLPALAFVAAMLVGMQLSRRLAP